MSDGPAARSCSSPTTRPPSGRRVRRPARGARTSCSRSSAASVRHGGGVGGATTLPFPVLRPRQRAIGRLAASGRFRAVVAGLSGRVALPAAYPAPAPRRVPFVLWATIWRHPRTAAHALSYLPLRHLYRHADAIATYGPHVSRLRARARARAGRCSRRRRASTTRSGPRPADAAPRRRRSR